MTKFKIGQTVRTKGEYSAFHGGTHVITGTVVGFGEKHGEVIFTVHATSETVNGKPYTPQAFEIGGDGWFYAGDLEAV